MHTLPNEVSGPIGTSTLFAAWNAAIYVAQIEDERLDDVVKSGAYLEATARRACRKHGGLWFLDESYVISRRRNDAARERRRRDSRTPAARSPRCSSTSSTTRRSRSRPDSARAIAALHEQFDPGTEVFVNFLPDGDYRAVAETAARLRRAGFTAGSAHRRAQPRRAPRRSAISWRASPARRGSTGCWSSPATGRGPPGRSRRAIDVLATGLLEAHGVRAVGVAGHPEGHPAIDSGGARRRARRQARLRRRGRARPLHRHPVLLRGGSRSSPGSVATRQAGIDAPVRIGVAGPATVATLVKFGMRCGIGNSLRAVRHAHRTPSAVSSAKSGPEDLFGDLAAGLVAHADSRVAGDPFLSVRRGRRRPANSSRARWRGSIRTSRRPAWPRAEPTSVELAWPISREGRPYPSRSASIAVSRSRASCPSSCRRRPTAPPRPAAAARRRNPRPTAPRREPAARAWRRARPATATGR